MEVKCSVKDGGLFAAPGMAEQITLMETGILSKNSTAFMGFCFFNNINIHGTTVLFSRI